MKTSLLNSIATVGCIVLGANAYAARGLLDAGVHANPDGWRLQHEQSRDVYRQKHDGKVRLAGGTGVGNPGSSNIVRPAPQGPVRDSRRP